MTKSTILKTFTATIAVAFIAAMSIPLLASAQGRGQGGQPEEVAERVNTRKQEAQERVAEKRESIEEKSQERRQEACERRVEKLDSTMDRIESQANRLLGVMNSFYLRVQGFYDSGQLTVANYDELDTAVSDAQANALTEIAALSELNVDVDCTDEEVAVSVGAFKNSASSAKESLRSYRAALVELISSMKAEAAAQSSDDSNDDSDSETDVETENESETESETETEIENENEQESESQDEVITEEEN